MTAALANYEAKQQARAVLAAQLVATYPYLIPAVTCKGGSLIAAAKNIRIELARTFPRVKFSVKTERFAGGDSLHVRWIDGPTADQVDPIVRRYQGGNFDGMTDSYTYEQRSWTDAFGSAKYTFADRDNSERAIESCIRTLLNRYPGNFEGIPIPTAAEYQTGALIGRAMPGFPFDQQAMVYQELRRRTWALPAVPATKAEG